MTCASQALGWKLFMRARLFVVVPGLWSLIPGDGSS